MQTKIIIYIIIGILVVAGIAGASWYFAIRQPAPPVWAPPVVTPPPEEVPPEEIPPPEGKEQSITVISPNGGETWVIGKTYDIIWRSSGIEKVDIRLASYDPAAPETIPIKSDLLASPGEYSWTLPQAEGGYAAYPGDKFRIEILDSSNYDRRDESNGFFSIVK